jgi:hypothetical protein
MENDLFDSFYIKLLIINKKKEHMRFEILIINLKAYNIYYYIIEYKYN